MLARHRVIATCSPCISTQRYCARRDAIPIVRTACYAQAARGRLVGKKIAIKNNIVTKDAPTTAGSGILSGYTSPFDATVVRLLKEHGADVSLKTELDEFGMGSHTQNSNIGPLESLYKRDGLPLSPGGSSGGSAMAVATGQAWAALGTDTGGSVRLPAAYTGVVGFKPSYGLLSRWGVIQYANSLDTVGVLSKDVASVRQVFEALNVYDARDSSSTTQSIRDKIIASKSSRGEKLRIGVPAEYNINELSPVVRDTWVAALTALQEAGHRIQNVSLPTTKQALSAYYVLAPAEASSNLAKYDGIRYGRRAASTTDEEGLPLYARARGQGFGEEVKRRILLGAYSLSSEAIDNYFIQAQKVRKLVQLDFNRVFLQQNVLVDDPPADDGIDILLTPTAPTLPPTLKELSKQSPLEAYMNDVFTVPASLAGLPAISIPASLTGEHAAQRQPDDVPCIGLQIIGQFGADDHVLEVAEMVHKLVS